MTRPLFRNHRPRTGRALCIAIAAIAAIGLFVLAAPYCSTQLLWGLRAALFWLLPLGLAAITTTAAAMLYRRFKGSRGERQVLNVGLGAAAAVMFLAFVWWVFDAHSYLQAHDYARHITVTDEPAPTLGQRAPYQVAAAQARPSLGDNPGNLVDTTYLPSGDTYTGLVAKRGLVVGYDAVLRQKVPLQGRAEGGTCPFGEAADDRVGGWFGSNLGRRINTEVRGVSWSDGDVYGYCVPDPGHPDDLDRATPMVVVPLTEQDGWLAVVERPAGVALYNGRTGALEIRRDTTGIPGPVYPLSLAASQRAAGAAMGGYADWWFGRVGWETSEGVDDTNSGNTAEYVLSDTATNLPLYVTPLTGRGSATAISALATVAASAPVDGTYAPVVVHRLPSPWVSPSSIVSRLKADYQDIPNWQTITVMEVAPLSGHRWVATLGNEQNVLYRAQGTGSLAAPAEGDTTPANQPTCLYRADGSIYRCGTLAGVAGNDIGTQYGTDPSAPQGTGTGAVETLTDAQLAELHRYAVQLQQRVGSEYERRLTHPMDR